MSDAPRPRARSWKEDPQGRGDAGKSATSRGRQIFGMAALLMVLVGLLAGFIYMFGSPPQSVLVPICVDVCDSYHLRNPLAQRDRELLTRLGKSLNWKVEDTQADRSRTLIQQRLQALATGISDEPVIVYVNALARVVDGKVYILVEDSKPEDMESAVLLDDVLQALARCPSKHKLLLLDLQRPIRHARLGLLGDDVGSGVKEAIAKIEDRTFHVVSAAAPLQDSLVGDELGQSVFAHYLAEGIRGAAAPWDPASRTPDRVTVAGLARYVQAQVERWSRLNRALEQTPLYWPPTKKFDFELSVARKAAPTPESEAAAAAPSPSATSPDDKPPEDPPEIKEQKAARSALVKLWEELDVWRDSGLGRATGAQLHHWQAKALLQEDRWRTGESVAEVRAEMEKLLGEIQRDRQTQERALFRDTTPSLAAAVARLRFIHGTAAAEPPAGLHDAIRRIVTSEPQADKKPLDEIYGEFFKDVTDDQRKRLIVAKAVFDVATELRGLNQKSLEMLLRCLPPAEQMPSYAELLFMRDLPTGPNAALLENALQVQQIVQPAMLLMRRGEELLAADPRHWPWLARVTAAAEAQRQAALLLLAHPGYIPPAVLVQQLNSARQTVAEADDRRRDLEQAVRLRDAVLADLPSLADMIVARPADALFRDQVERWRGLAAEWSELDSLLQPPAAGSAPAAGELAQSLRAALDRAKRLEERTDTLRRDLVEKFRQRLKEIHDSASDNPGDYAELSAMLAWTWLPAQERMLLLDARRKLGERLRDRTAKADFEDEQRHRSAAPVFSGARDPNQAPDPRAVEFNQLRALTLARLSIDLLRFAGLPEAEFKDFDFASPPASVPVAWGEPLAKLWRQRLREKLEEVRAVPTLAGDRLTRIYFHGPLAPWEEFTKNENNQLALRLFTSNLQARDQWLTRHYLEQEAAWADVELWAKFFRETAPVTLRFREGGAAARLEIDLPSRLELQADEEDGPVAGGVDLGISLSAGELAPDDVRVNVLADTKWIQSQLTALQQAGPSRLRARLSLVGLEEAKAGDAEPKGVWVQVWWRDRVASRRLDLGNLAGRLRRPRLLLARGISPTDEIDPTVSKLNLRTAAGVQQPLFVFVNNPDKVERRLRVRMFIDGQLVQSSSEFRLPPGSEFKSVPEVGRLYEKARPDDKPRAVAREVAFELFDAETNTPVMRRNLGLSAEPLSALVRLERPIYRNGELRLEFTALRNFPETAPLEIELRTQPGIDEPVERRPDPLPPRLEQITRAGRKDVVLKVERNLRLGRGEVTVRVDGVSRAFLVHFWQDESRPAEIVTTPQVRIEGDDYVRPGTEPKFTIATANLRDVDYEWDLTSFGGDEAVARPRRPARHTAFLMDQGGPDFGLLLSAQVADYQHPLRVPAHGDTLRLRVTLRDTRGQMEATKEVVIADPLRLRPTDLEAQLADGQIELRLAPTPRRVPIRSVKFYRGEQVDPKFLLRPAEDDPFRVVLPDPTREPALSVIVEVEDFAGQKDQMASNIDLARLRSEAARADFGSVKATVLRDGRRGGRGYMVVVFRRNATGGFDEVARGETNQQSEVSLRGLAPGSYVVSCQLSDGTKKANRDVTVEKRKETPVELDLR